MDGGLSVYSDDARLVWHEDLDNVFVPGARGLHERGNVTVREGAGLVWKKHLHTIRVAVFGGAGKWRQASGQPRLE
jgi:hypothetical protein